MASQSLEPPPVDQVDARLLGERNRIAREVARRHDGAAHRTSRGDDAFELALARGRDEAREFVLLPADLPRLAAADVDALVHAGRRTRIAIAPDRRGTGTNGLYLDARLDFRCRFGGASRAHHESEARRVGVEPAIVIRPGLASDLDTRADLGSLGYAGAGRAGVAACVDQPA